MIGKNLGELTFTSACVNCITIFNNPLNNTS